MWKFKYGFSVVVSFPFLTAYRYSQSLLITFILLTPELRIFLCSIIINFLMFKLFSEDDDNKKPALHVKKSKRPNIDPEEKRRKKKEKFDPTLPHTVTQVQEHMFSKIPEPLTRGMLCFFDLR